MIGFKRLMLYFIVTVLSGVSNIAIKLVPFKTLIRLMTNEVEVKAEVLTNKQAYRLESVVLVLNRIHNHVFWRVKCYEQALVALFFARLLGADMMIYFGVMKGEQGELLAHTWTQSGGMYITGGDNAHEFSVVYNRGYRKKGLYVNKNR